MGGSLLSGPWMDLGVGLRRWAGGVSTAPLHTAQPRRWRVPWAQSASLWTLLTGSLLTTQQLLPAALEVTCVAAIAQH
jgi:hypothetical protein